MSMLYPQPAFSLLLVCLATYTASRFSKHPPQSILLRSEPSSAVSSLIASLPLCRYYEEGRLLLASIA